ncbi:NarK/NasA family nitrate transporter, partial [Planosporangium flavigriseum]
MTISAARKAPITALATSGFAVNVAAWTLVGAIEPYLQRQYDIGSAREVALAAPLVVGALACVPVGALTDRYGARLTFPLVSIVSAASVATLAMVHTAPALVLVGAALGIGAAAFAVGAAALTRSDPPGRRGRRLSTLGGGIGGAAIGAELVRPLVDQVGVRTALLPGSSVVLRPS